MNTYSSLIRTAALLIVGLVLSATLSASNPSVKADCNTGSIVEQCLCWMNKARQNPEIMASLLTQQPTRLSSTDEEIVKKMLKGETTTPPPKPGRQHTKYLVKDVNNRKGNSVDQCRYYAGLPQLSMNSYLTELGQYHFAIGMGDTRTSDGSILRNFGHDDVNGHGDIEKAGCIYDVGATGGKLTAGIYGGSPTQTGYEMFLSILSGYTHVRPLFNIVEDWKYIGIHRDPSTGNFILVYSENQPVAYTNKCGLDNQASGRCPDTHLPAHVRSLSACAPARKLNLRSINASASQSSLAQPQNKGAQLAIDGNTDGNYNNGSVCYTDKEATPKLTIDLKRNYSISQIVIHNRTDNYSGRLRNINVFIGKAGSSKLAGVATLNGEHAESKVTIPIYPPVDGGLIIIQTDNSSTAEGKDNLHVAEVEVFTK
ncbi:MAG: discoidin domain-containing protein [Bacteroidota bacterium]